MKDYVGQLISSNTQPGYHIVILHIIQIELKYLHYLSLSFYKNRNNYQWYKTKTDRIPADFVDLDWIWIGTSRFCLNLIWTKDGSSRNWVFEYSFRWLMDRMVDMTPQPAGGEMTVLKFLDEVKSIESGIQRIR